MGRKFQNKKKKAAPQLEIVPLDENPPLPPQRSSDEVVPKKACTATPQNLQFINLKPIL